MDQLLIQPDELRKAAQEFTQASKDTAATLKRLDDATGELESKWAGVSQQVFYKQYTELRQYMAGFSALLTNIAREMNAMAERFEDADR